MKIDDVKSCFVPFCPNSSRNRKTEFVSVPMAPSLRKKWLKAVGCHQTADILYCCDKHFDVPGDFENYPQCKYLGDGLKVKAEILPHNNITRRVCRFCLGKIYAGEKYVDLLGNVEAQEMIRICLPEMEVDIVYSPVACLSCFKSLKEFYNKKVEILKNEVKIMTCLKRCLTDHEDRIVSGSSLDIMKCDDLLGEYGEAPDPPIVSSDSDLSSDSSCEQQTKKSSCETIPEGDGKGDDLKLNFSYKTASSSSFQQQSLSEGDKKGELGLGVEKIFLGSGKDSFPDGCDIDPAEEAVAATYLYEAKSPRVQEEKISVEMGAVCPFCDEHFSALSDHIMEHIGQSVECFNCKWASPKASLHEMTEHIVYHSKNKR